MAVPQQSWKANGQTCRKEDTVAKNIQSMRSIRRKVDELVDYISELSNDQRHSTVARRLTPRVLDRADSFFRHLGSEIVKYGDS